MSEKPTVLPGARSCGECKVCCTLLNIDTDPKVEPEWHKDAGVPCEHLCDKGCSIYEKKPLICSDYYCMWAANRPEVPLQEAERPDKSGILVNLNNPNSQFTKFYGRPNFTIYETYPGAFNGYWADKVIKRLARKLLLFCMPWEEQKTQYRVHDNIRFLGPLSAMRAVDYFTRG